VSLSKSTSQVTAIMERSFLLSIWKMLTQAYRINFFKEIREIADDVITCANRRITPEIIFN
jgi:hypothetical protein